ncbi:MAG: D-alanyl-D-alanine carboxypeptidase family protein, partial [Candidatus Sericytochromatia bacterium]
MSWSKVLAATTIGLMSCLAPVSAALAAPAPAAVTTKAPPAPALSAAAAVVLDVQSGQLLFGRNTHTRRAPASTTKIMTGLLAVESGRLDEVVTISKRAASIGEATIYLKEGEQLTLRELTYGVLLSSGNDASTAVAEFVAGSEAKFVEMMNERAKELGLTNTHFNNPHGLPAEDHYSTAYDLAQLLRVAIQNPEWQAIAATKWKKVPLQGKADGRTLKNHNKLLWSYPYASSGKTGYTFAAGRCFVGSAKKGNRQVVQTVLGAPDLWADAQKMLAYGLDNFENLLVARRGEVVGTVPIQAGSNRVVEVIAPRDVSVCLPRGTVDSANLQQVWQLPDELVAPVEENQTVGKLIVRQGDKVLTSVPLVAATAVPIASGAWEHISSWFFPGML